jgi:hypothetical protein
MKKIIPLLMFLLAITACSKKEVKFELFSAEAFAYSLDSGYELDARTMAKGFKVTKTGDLFSVQLNYSADLILPDGTVKKDAAAGIIKREEKEEFTEVEISVQKELDTSYPLGKYKVVFNVTDESAKKQLKIEKEFELSK